jgi:glycerophosphoryl diester phosphodiesterase
MLRGKENIIELRRIGFTRRAFLRIGALYGLTLAVRRRLSVCLAANDASGAVFCSFSGDAPRPFYIIGHGSNSIPLVRQNLASGANALEADVNIYRSRPNQLCVDHGPKLTGGRGSDDAPSLVEYLTQLHSLARENPDFALVYFDCKPPAATAEHGAALIEAIRANLIGEGQDRIKLDVIISVASFREAAIFSRIVSNLRSGEALMIDQEEDPSKVSEFFTNIGARNQCYCNGASVANAESWLFAPHLRSSIEEACLLRTKDKKIKFVGVWTVNDLDLMREYITMGVDGIITDIAPPVYNSGQGLAGLTALVSSEGSGLGIRKASRTDQPFS